MFVPRWRFLCGIPQYTLWWKARLISLVWDNQNHLSRQVYSCCSLESFRLQSNRINKWFILNEGISLFFATTEQLCFQQKQKRLERVERLFPSLLFKLLNLVSARSISAEERDSASTRQKGHTNYMATTMNHYVFQTSWAQARCVKPTRTLGTEHQVSSTWTNRTHIVLKTDIHMIKQVHDIRRSNMGEVVVLGENIDENPTWMMGILSMFSSRRLSSSEE